MSLPRTVAAHRWPSRPLARLYLHPETILQPAVPPCSRRLFHSTPTHNAARKPPRALTSRLRETRHPPPPRQVVYTDLGVRIYNRPVSGDRQAMLAYISLHGEFLCRSSIEAGRLPWISTETFSYVAKRFIEEAFAGPPTALAARRISKDVDIVFLVALVLSVFSEQIFGWAISATASAGGVLPVLHLATLQLDRVQIPPRSPLLDRIEVWATESENPDPRVALVYAKILGQRGRYEEAIAVMEKVMERTCPTKLRVPADKDITLLDSIEPPWKLYAWLKEKVGDRAATDRTLKMAALEYQDPGALVTYAHVMQTEGNLEMYEECMNKAATAGNAEACRKLANFYYLTYHGRFPRREEQNPKSIRSRIASLFKQSRPKDDYRKLALDWYELAFNHGSYKAALLLSMLLREDGLVDMGREFLSLAAHEPKLGSLTKKMIANWENEDYDVNIPIQLLDT